MRLQEQIKSDLKIAMKAKDEERKNAIRVVMGEFARLESKALSDDDVIKVLKKLIKSERELLEKTGGAETPFIGILEAYLPQMASEADILAWVRENIDLSEFKNKMQAMKPIMAHFGTQANGNVVKKILQQL
ncbi:hypothetical protein DENIS_1491 [Desulfonema ishimotonii]|uniref:Glutamyl-tRNA amidotransferase n=1 Tax=Desulfonema ishimotonii TaxID=45657 RepID=A0A401FUA6_9BACT|nr:GatB/YqeY domain-containing protein [Desulfonema ishimotonii]GBC60534.1 hypothetical protein DENIS_1491 [Desulfonema ishimotonii]